MKRPTSFTVGQANIEKRTRCGMACNRSSSPYSIFCCWVWRLAGRSTRMGACPESGCPISRVVRSSADWPCSDEMRG
ncbi:MAG: hypothetical protein WCK35_13310 [Chloroflexota bacterium]